MIDTIPGVLALILIFGAWPAISTLRDKLKRRKEVSS